MCGPIPNLPSHAMNGNSHMVPDKWTVRSGSRLKTGARTVGSQLEAKDTGTANETEGNREGGTRNKPRGKERLTEGSPKARSPAACRNALSGHSAYHGHSGAATNHTSYTLFPGLSCLSALSAFHARPCPTTQHSVEALKITLGLPELTEPTVSAEIGGLEFPVSFSLIMLVDPHLPPRPHGQTSKVPVRRPSRDFFLLPRPICSSLLSRRRRCRPHRQDIGSPPCPNISFFLDNVVFRRGARRRLCRARGARQDRIQGRPRGCLTPGLRPRPVQWR